VKIIPVTCAIIFHQGKVLAAQRSVIMPLPGKWEFPGGKVEEGEAPEACLIREIREELAIDIRIFGALQPSEFSYTSQKTIRLIPFLATWEAGDIRLLEHSEVKWIGPEELFSLDWAAADVPIVHELQEKWVKLVSQIKTAR
jgi:8-oxo-dGTP diphosphatase